MRQSVATRTSHSAASASSAAAMSKLLEKKKEYDAVSALEKASLLFLERIEALSEDCDIMANAGEVHGQVLAQWPKMFQILTQFLASTPSSHTMPESLSSVSHTRISEGQRLVRIPIEGLQEANEEKA